MSKCKGGVGRGFPDAPEIATELYTARQGCRAPRNHRRKNQQRTDIPQRSSHSGIVRLSGNSRTE
ncbi:MAG: hypothetical protein FWG36_02530 [Oscillospiraceae bacterium]|nr:hypothetical protein [Oscillospiraceae bacterium]